MFMHLETLMHFYVIIYIISTFFLMWPWIHIIMYYEYLWNAFTMHYIHTCCIESITENSETSSPGFILE